MDSAVIERITPAGSGTRHWMFWSSAYFIGQAPLRTYHALRKSAKKDGLTGRVAPSPNNRSRSLQEETHVFN